MQAANDHLLDNPIWHALTGPHAGLATIYGPVRRYLPHFAPFVAWEAPTAETAAALPDAVLPHVRTALFTAGPVAVPEGLTTVAEELLVQMVGADLGPISGSFEFVRLEAANVPEVESLIELTQPGPFARRTIEMGQYLGAFDNGKLVAMAGERLRLKGFCEVSAVCTHPQYRGRGYAKALVSAVSQAITARGQTPFLHVRPGNLAAIKTYEALGFVERRKINLTVVARPEVA